MLTSQNVRFFWEAKANPDFERASQDLEHPPGGFIASFLRERLLQLTWRVSDLDNWRDCGWVFFCCNDRAQLQLVLAQMAASWDWVLQICPKYVPGIIGRLFGKERSATPNDVYEIARSVHEIISMPETYDDIAWCWDSVPNDRNASKTPIPPVQ